MDYLEVSLDNESGENGYENQEDEDYDGAENSDHELDEEADEIEDEANETTLLCPAANQNEIIISPSTLNCASKVDVPTEDIYMTNFKVPHKRYHRD